MDAQNLATPDQQKSARDEIRESYATAVALHRAGHLENAARLYEAILRLDPEHADTWHMLGMLAHANGQADAARRCLARATALRPADLSFQFHFGVVLQTAGDHAAAIAPYSVVVNAKPEHKEAQENLGVALQAEGRISEATKAYRTALTLDATSYLARTNLATLLLECGDSEPAIALIDGALTERPLDYRMRHKRASVDLWQGRFEDGWRAYEQRFCSADFCENSPLFNAPWPEWNGAPLPDGTLLVTREQGLGDDILFASCMAELVQHAGHVIIATDPRLISLYQRAMPGVTVVSCHDDLSKFDIDRRISAGSLPSLLRRTADTFTPRIFLWPDADRRSHWKDWLERRGPGLKIGLSWRGGLAARAQSMRSIPLRSWLPVFQVPGVECFNIQYGEHDAEIERAQEDGLILNAVPGLDCRDDIDELAAFISALDLVITIDNATAHVAGALGVPTWVLRGPHIEWRWTPLAGRNPWFQSVRQFVASEPLKWDTVLDEAAEQLGAYEGKTPEYVAPPDAPAVVSPPRKRASHRRKCVLLNDTSDWYHFGCTATSHAIHDQLRRREYSVTSVPIHEITGLRIPLQRVEQIDEEFVYKSFRTAHPEVVSRLETADEVVVNGEGTLHRLNAQPLSLLYLMRIASARLGKPVHVINHSCYPNGVATVSNDAATELYRHVYDGLASVAVREPVSAALLRNIGLDVTESFDCLPLYIRSLYESADTTPRRPYVVIAGGVTLTAASAPVFADLIEELGHRGLDVQILVGARAYPASDEAPFVHELLRVAGRNATVRSATSTAEWLDAIGGARLLVSGRFHHTIAAAFLNTPFLVAQSNTPKIDGLLNRLKLDAGWPAASADHTTSCGRDAIINAATDRLDAPDRYMLQPDTREGLLTLSDANFNWTNVAPGARRTSAQAPT
ncbi:MAG: polysaccharide pyruvyl transferase family protein [Pseudomonadota bacterium]